jgi:hypothetical protein
LIHKIGAAIFLIVGLSALVQHYFFWYRYIIWNKKSTHPKVMGLFL